MSSDKLREQTKMECLGCNIGLELRREEDWRHFYHIYEGRKIYCDADLINWSIAALEAEGEADDTD